MLAACVISRSCSSIGSAIASITRSAIARTSSSDTSSQSSANSSPPSRARVSPARSSRSSRRATSIRTWSPAAWPERVVDQLEAVEVEVDDREAADPAPGRGHPHAVGEQRPVGKAGERVVERLAGEPLLGLLAIGHVLDLSDQVAGRAVLAVVDRRDVERDPDRMAVGVDVPLLRPVAVALSLDQITQRVQVRVDVVGVGDLAESLADQFVPGVARELAERAIDPLKAAVGRDDRHPHPAVVEGPAEALLGLPRGRRSSAATRRRAGARPARDCRRARPHARTRWSCGVVGRMPRDGDGEEQREPHARMETASSRPSRRARTRSRGGHQRVEDARGVAARVPEQRDDDEVGEGRDRLGPGGQAGPGHPERERDHDREERRGDRTRGSETGTPAMGSRANGRRPASDERCDPPADVHAFEEPPRAHVEADRARPADGRPGDRYRRLRDGSLSSSFSEVPLSNPDQEVGSSPAIERR